MSRLPNVGADGNAWGAVLNDFLSVEQNANGTLKFRSGGNMSGPLGFLDANSNLRAQAYSVSGDFWFLSNAQWNPNDGQGGNFYRIDQTHAAFGLQMQAQGYIPGEPQLGYYVAGATFWVAQPESYTLIRGGGSLTGAIFGAVGGWELGITVTQQRQLTVGGGGIEIDGYGTIPYGRVVNNTTGTLLAHRMVGMMQNAYTDIGGYDDPTQEAWYWGYLEDYNPAGGGPPYPVVAGSSRWSVAWMPPNNSASNPVFTEYLKVKPTGVIEVHQDPTTPLGVATKEYVDGVGSGVHGAKGGEAFFTGNGTATTFFQPHSLGTVPSRVHLTPMNAASIGCWYTKDATNVGINYATAPANGVTIGVSWTAFP